MKLVASSTYLGEDFTGTWRYYPAEFQKEGKKRLAGLLPEIAADDEAVLMSGMLKKQFLSKMDENGIEVVFMTRAAGIEEKDSRAIRVKLADKLGIVSEECDLLADATLNRSFTRLLTGEIGVLKAGKSAGVMLEYMSLPTLFAVTGIPEAKLLRGLVSKEHAFLSIRKTFLTDTPLEKARAELMALCARATKAVAADERSANAYLTGTFSPEMDLEIACGTESPLKNLYTPKEILCGAHRKNEKASAYSPKIEEKKILCDVFVAGAGTAGVRTAFAAAQAGAKVVCAEFFTTLGGTRTTGGVQPPYDGNRNDLFLDMWKEITAYSKERCKNPKDRSSAACEAILYEEKMRRYGITLIRPALLVSAEKQEDRIESVLLLGEDGYYRVEATVFTDATGDGDLAYLSGVPMHYGDDELGATQNYSQFHRMSGTDRDIPMADQDVMDINDRSEWQRALRQNTQRSSPYDLVEMLTVRESRRIEGLDSVKLSDIYRERRPADAIYDCMSDYDTHSRCFSAVGRFGVLPSHAPIHFVSVPFGALLPKTIENLMVCAKAVSAEQEAGAHMRMSPDVMCVGHICGQIAAIAAKTKCPLRKIDISSLQEELFKQGALIKKPGEREYFEVTPRMLAARLAAGDESAFADAVLCGYEELPSLLKRMLSVCAENSRHLIAKVLLYYGDTAFAPEIAKELKRANDAYGVQRRKDVYRVKIVNGGDRSGRDEYWKINTLVMLLAKNGCTEYADLICGVIENTTIGEYFSPAMLEALSVRPDILVHGNFDRFMCLACAVCMMPHGCFAEPILKLYRMSTEDETCRFVFADCWLHLKLAQAAYLCGSADAKRILEGMCEHRYFTVRKSAQKILAEGQM